MAYEHHHTHMFMRSHYEFSDDMQTVWPGARLNKLPATETQDLTTRNTAADLSSKSVEFEFQIDLNRLVM